MAICRGPLANHSRVVKITSRRNINYVAQHVSRRRCTIYRIIDYAVGAAV